MLRRGLTPRQSRGAALLAIGVDTDFDYAKPPLGEVDELFERDELRTVVQVNIACASHSCQFLWITCKVIGFVGESAR